MHAKTIGVIAMIFASLMWALEPIFAKLSYSNSDFLHTFSIRLISVTLTALIYILARRKRFYVTKKQFSTISIIAIVGTLFADLLFFMALIKVPVINAVLVGHLQPVFIILIGYLFLKTDKLNLNDLIGVSFMILAGIFVTTKTIVNLTAFKIGTFADLLVLMSTVGWAVTSVIARKFIKDVDPGIITFYRFLVAAFIFNAYLILKSSFYLSNHYQIIVGIISGAGYILYYEGLKRLKAAQVGALELFTPFFAAALSFLMLGEIITQMQKVGISLLLVGVYYISKKENN